ncbi:class I SAM-dependent methyltransferase [Mycobacteroides abscessus]|uniref:class I SAM-dependent methyltransferase n=1 Tax=Mycobacteroides abscessus TaxID=36809 RepID=UPI001F22C832|nr:class I SAM-dependent methyltransferase [Mycobacteroides abscessus]
MYDSGVMHESLATVAAAVLWGASFQQILAVIQHVADSPAGSYILDSPCGGGFAFRGLRHRQNCRYVAADISPNMLARARRRASSQGVADLVEFAEADITMLPYAENTFDLVLTFNGLHCLSAPQAALTELVRVLKPGGILRGTTCVRGVGWRQDLFVRVLRAASVFGNSPQTGDVERWLVEAGLEVVVARRSGAVELFEACKPVTDA